MGLARFGPGSSFGTTNHEPNKTVAALSHAPFPVLDPRAGDDLPATAAEVSSLGWGAPNLPLEDYKSIGCGAHG